MHTKSSSENLKGRHAEDNGVNERIILKFILGSRVRRCGLNLSRSAEALVAGSCGYDNEPSGSIKGGEFL